MPKLNMTHVARRIAILVLLTGAGWTMGADRAAATDFDLRAGYYMDHEMVGLGAGLLTSVGNEGRWFFNPNLEVGFGDERSLVSVNGDFHYDFAQSSNTTVWLGAGPAVIIDDPPSGDTDTNLGLNVLAGLGGTQGGARPFAQLKGVVSDDSEVVLQGGVRF